MSTPLRNTLAKHLHPAEKNPEPAPRATDELIGIAEMAKLFDTTYRTLRFYESKGLLKAQRDGMNRFYDAESRRQFRLINEGRQLGFTLSEIAKLLESSSSKDQLQLSLDTIADQIEHLEQQRTQVEEALTTLRKRYYLMSGTDEADVV